MSYRRLTYSADTPECVSTGRNGDYTTSGLDVSTREHSDQLQLTLAGRNKLGNPVRGDLVLPLADVPALIGQLHSLYAEQASGLGLDSLQNLKRVLRNQALRLIDEHFAAHPEPIRSATEDHVLVDEDVSDSYGDPAEIIILAAAHYTVRGKATGDHSDLTYVSLDTDVLLQVVARLSEPAEDDAFLTEPFEGDMPGIYA